MPREQLSMANEAARSQYPHWKHPALHYGYEMTNAVGLQFAPYIIIRVADAPAEPKAVLEEMSRDALPQGVERRGPVFEDRLNACVVRYQANFGAIQADATAAYFLTKKSVIKVFLFVPATDDRSLIGLARQTIENVSISDELKWAAPPVRSPFGLIAALTALVLLALVLWRAKPATSSKPPQPCASPNGCPAQPLGSSGVGDGPPSVS